MEMGKIKDRQTDSKTSPTGDYLYFPAGLCLVFSVFALIAGIVSGDGTVFYRSAVCILLSLVLFGIRSLIRAINANKKN